MRTIIFGSIIGFLAPVGVPALVGALVLLPPAAVGADTKRQSGIDDLYWADAPQNAEMRLRGNGQDQVMVEIITAAHGSTGMAAPALVRLSPRELSRTEPSTLR